MVFFRPQNATGTISPALTVIGLVSNTTEPGKFFQPAPATVARVAGSLILVRIPLPGGPTAQHLVVGAHGCKRAIGSKSPGYYGKVAYRPHWSADQ